MGRNNKNKNNSFYNNNTMKSYICTIAALSSSAFA